MTLPTSGALSLSAIQTEFGGSNPISMSEYYAGGANVPSGTTGTNGQVPASGALSFNIFHGTTRESELSIVAADVSANADGFGAFTGNPEAHASVTPSGGSGSYSSFTHEYVSGDVLNLDPNGSVQNPGIYKSGGISVPPLGASSLSAVYRVTVQDSEGHTASDTYNVTLTCTSTND